jgi:hypothetical protein
VRSALNSYLKAEEALNGRRVAYIVSRVTRNATATLNAQAAVQATLQNSGRLPATLPFDDSWNNNAVDGFSQYIAGNTSAPFKDAFNSWVRRHAGYARRRSSTPPCRPWCPARLT